MSSPGPSPKTPKPVMLFSGPGLRDNAIFLLYPTPGPRPRSPGCGLYLEPPPLLPASAKINLRSEIARESLCTLHKAPLHSHQVQVKHQLQYSMFCAAQVITKTVTLENNISGMVQSRNHLQESSGKSLYLYLYIESRRKVSIQAINEIER